MEEIIGIKVCSRDCDCGCAALPLIVDIHDSSLRPVSAKPSAYKASIMILIILSTKLLFVFVAVKSFDKILLKLSAYPDTARITAHAIASPSSKEAFNEP